MKALVLVVLVAVGVFGAKSLLDQPAPPPVVNVNVNPAPPPTAAPDETALVLDEATLSDRLNSAVAGLSLGDTPLGPATARDLAVQLRDGQVRVTGQAQAGGASLPVSMAAGVRVESEQPIVDLREAKVGSIALPEGTRRQLEQLLQQQVNQVLMQNQVQVRSVTIADGVLTLIGSRASS